MMSAGVEPVLSDEDEPRGPAGRALPDSPDEEVELPKIGGPDPSTERLSADSDIETGAVDQPMLDARDTEELPTLRDEFAVGKKLPTDWRDDIEGLRTCTEADGDACHFLTALICGMCLGARRLGNMAVLLSRRGSTGRTELLCMVGPYWPCLVVVTYPLILGVSLWSAVYRLPEVSIWIRVIWAMCTITLVVALACTGCRNPGVVRRWKTKPPRCDHWYWSDQVGTFRPPRAQYDGDCGVVIEEFDHTCPWTGTGIGKRNMTAFSTFVTFVCVCLIFNILLLVGALSSL